MSYRIINWAWHRLRPVEGWLPVLLLLAIIVVMASEVTVVRWAPEGIVVWIALLGLILALVLAKRPLGWLPAWAILLAYGLVVTTIWLGRLWPPLTTLFSGREPTAAHIRQNWGLLVDRFGGWFTAVLGGGSSQETIVFAFGLGLLAWLLAAYASWSTFRQRRPLAGLTAIGLALAVNGYYGNAPLEPVTLFIGLAALLAALVHFAGQEQNWDAKGIDYSTEIRLDLLMNSAVIAMFLLALAYFVPAINWNVLSRAVLDRPAVHQAEDTLERAFAGVRQPKQEPINVEPGGDSAAAGGEFPRSYLLGNPPELSETVVLTATVFGEHPHTTHWRGLSYDIYTGRGWAVSAERKAVIAANQAIPLPAHEEQNSLEQTISWAFGESTTRYTLGLPTQFDQEVSVFWRGLGDLSRVQGEGVNYSARSSVPAATADQLRQATMAGVPPAILARYTELPESVPGRVHELAQEVAAVSQVPLSPYDQAKALEQFLRQYPYSTDVELPPAGADPVDFFLFDLQTGYCDYYASAMVIMARSLGLPARLAAGFLAQPADEFGRQTIYQINGHSWAEIYFADYGWVEFEPTAPFPAGEEVLGGPITAPFEDAGHRSAYAPPAIPEKRTPQWLYILLLVPILFIAGLWWIRRRRPGVAKDDGILWAYDRLLHRAQQLGQPTPLSQTPIEFEASLLDRLNALEKQPVIGRLKVSKVYPQIKRLTASFVARRYSEHRPPPEAAVKSWKRIRGRLWFVSILEKVAGFIHADRA